MTLSHRRTPIRAEIDDSNRCSAEGHVGRGAVPVLALCRLMVANGFDPRTPLEAYRGAILCLSVRTIGAGARLTVADGEDGRPRFRPWKAMQTGDVSLRIAPNGPGVTTLAAPAI